LCMPGCGRNLGVQVRRPQTEWSMRGIVVAMDEIVDHSRMLRMFLKDFFKKQLRSTAKNTVRKFVTIRQD